MIALTRSISPSIARCELTYVSRETIDVERAQMEHLAYERALAEGGCDVRRLDSTAEMPDSVFIEDTAVVFDEIAIVARPGAPTRRAEIPAVERALAEYRPLVRIEAPGTLDGGDILVVGRRVFVGVSGRTNAAAIGQLRAALSRHGYAVTAVPVSSCLHLKSAVSTVAGDLLLANPNWIDAAPFAPCRLIEVDPAEPFGANALRLADAVIYPDAFPKTAARLESRGLIVKRVPAGELAKAEGGVTCCSLIVA